MNTSRPALRSRLEHFLNVSHPDPAEALRGRLLNILLLGIAVFCLVVLVVMLSIVVFGLPIPSDTPLGLLLLSLSCLLLITIGLYSLNRRGHFHAAAILFVMGLVLIVVVSDEPRNLLDGRSTVAMAIPIMLASAVIAPAASFGLTAFEIVLALILIGPEGILAFSLLIRTSEFLMVALVGWLSARTLGNALADLRQINVELDHRVASRTKELAEALINVQLESGKNQAILESIADGVIVFDETGKALVTNPAISELLDRPQNKLLGYTIDELMEGRAELGDNTQRLPNIKFQWGSKTVSASFAPVRLSSTAMTTGTVAVFRDFTKEAEIDRMKSAFVSMVSHELRTPLSAIVGYTEMLRDGVYGELNDKQMGIVGRLTVNAKRLMSLVFDLLDRAQLEAGKMTLRISAFSPATALIDELLPVVSEQVNAKGLELITRIAPDVPAQLTGDPQRLLQVLINLVSNSIKFTEKGHIAVDISRVDAGHLKYEVSDTGIGIPVKDQAHIFESFRQVDGTTTRQHAGFGLGLSIVKQLVVLMGGEISLSSRVGQGSTFTVILPLVVQMPEEKTS